MRKIDYAALEALSTEKLEALEEQLAMNLKREEQERRRKLEEQARKSRKKRKMQRSK